MQKSCLGLMGLVMLLAASACGGDDTSTAEPAKFSKIYDDILFVRCATAGCHNDMGGGSAGNLDFSTREKAYAALVDVTATGVQCKDSGLKRVVPAEPENSLLFSKVSEAPPACGDPMPLGSMLDAESLASIKSWIAAGALNE